MVDFRKPGHNWLCDVFKATKMSQQGASALNPIATRQNP